MMLRGVSLFTGRTSRNRALSDSEFRSSPFLDRVEDLLAELLLVAWELVFATLRRASGRPRKAFSDALTRRSIG
jgi:hypothetical protein